MNGYTCTTDRDKPIKATDYFTHDLWIAGISFAIAKKKKKKKIHRSR